MGKVGVRRFDAHRRRSQTFILWEKQRRGRASDSAVRKKVCSNCMLRHREISGINCSPVHLPWALAGPSAQSGWALKRLRLKPIRGDYCCATTSLRRGHQRRSALGSAYTWMRTDARLYGLCFSAATVPETKRRPFLGLAPIDYAAKHARQNAPRSGCFRSRVG